MGQNVKQNSARCTEKKKNLLVVVILIIGNCLFSSSTCPLIVGALQGPICSYISVCYFKTSWDDLKI